MIMIFIKRLAGVELEASALSTVTLRPLEGYGDVLSWGYLYIES
jgi:hypothetical protein